MKEICPRLFPGTEVDWYRTAVSIEFSHPSKCGDHVQPVYQERSLAHLDSQIVPGIVRRVLVPGAALMGEMKCQCLGT